MTKDSELNEAIERANVQLKALKGIRSFYAERGRSRKVDDLMIGSGEAAYVDDYLRNAINALTAFKEECKKAIK